MVNQFGLKFKILILLNMKLELTFYKQLKALFTSIIMFLAIIFIAYYVGFNDKNTYKIIIPLIVILILPTLYLHINYYNKCKNYVYILNEDEIKVIKNNREVDYRKENFKEIKIYMSGTRMAGLALRNFPFENYYYTKIVMHDKHEIIIPCLFSNNIDRILVSLYNEIPVIKIKSFYPNIV